MDVNELINESKNDLIEKINLSLQNHIDSIKWIPNVHDSIIGEYKYNNFTSTWF
jgi:hypothetical protein